MKENRKHFLDLLRIIACFLVIVNHTNSTIFMHSSPNSIRWYVSLAFFFVSKIAVPVFFMISGYLLLNKVEDWKKTFSRVLRIIVVLLVCAVIYAIYNGLFISENGTFKSIVEDILLVYKKSPTNALWYLYAYIGILLMLPFLQKRWESLCGM